MNSTTARSDERPTAFLDTSVLLGYLLDEEERAKRCLALLQRAEHGELRLRTTSLVVAEIVWTLQSSRYGLSAEEIRDRIAPVLDLRSLILEDKHLYAKVFELFCKHDIDFTDAYNAALMSKEDVAQIYSYDRHYDRLAFLERMEP
jgi:predicted nucleic acid-binding protein